MPSIESLLLERFNEAFNHHDIDSMMRLMTDDCLFENTFPAPDGDRYLGQASVSAFWEQFFQSSPHAQIEIEDVYTNQELGVQRWIYRWVDAEGKPGHVRGVDIFCFRDGKISEKLSYVKG
jgi:steroid delta-isomerase-like uncharacterized protein